MTTAEHTETVTIEATGARWFTQKGANTFHLQVGEDLKALCGKELRKDSAREAWCGHAKCTRCTKKATDEQLDAAERRKKAVAAAMKEAQTRHLDRNRAGTFTVHRCKRCGGQKQRPGSYFCTDHDLCDVEAIEVNDPSVALT